MLDFGFWHELADFRGRFSAWNAISTLPAKTLALSVRWPSVTPPLAGDAQAAAHMSFPLPVARAEGEEINGK
jgi:hypothetical protein